MPTRSARESNFSPVPRVRDLLLRFFDNAIDQVSKQACVYITTRSISDGKRNSCSTPHVISSLTFRVRIAGNAQLQNLRFGLVPQQIAKLTNFWLAIVIAFAALNSASPISADELACRLQEKLQTESLQDNWLEQAIGFAQRRMVKVFGAGAGRVNSYATGIIVSAEGHIVTMQGVFLDGDQVRVALPDGELVTASVLRRDRQYQLALLKIPNSTPDFFELSDQSVGQKGDWVVALSNAFMVAEREEPMSATLGIISLPTSMEARLNKDSLAYRGELVLIDAITSNPGAGGGAVVTSDGTLVGMIGKVINSSETNTRLNYAVPSKIIKRFVAGQPIDALPTTAVASDQKPTLGLELFKLGGKGGPAYVDRIVPNSPAAATGLKPDDLLVSLGGEKIGSVRDYERVLPTLTVGSEIILVVKRGQELLRLPIIPAAEK